MTDLCVSSNLQTDMDEDEDIDELDELLGLLDEDEQTEQKQEEIAQNEQKRLESEIYVSDHCKLRVDVETRAISTESLRLRLKRWTFVSMLNLPLKLNNKCVVNNEFVIIGILASKSIKTSKNDNKYLLIKLDDFKASISCFIFNAEIIEKFYKIQVGTILVIAGPQIMNDSKSNSTNLSLKIEEIEQILIVGKSKDFGFCPKILKDGNSRCQNVINKAKNDLCSFHKAQSYKKYASKRIDTNRSSLSRILQNGKKSLSGNNNIKMNRRMNGISMMQRSGNRKKKNVQNVDYKMARKKTSNLLLSSSAMTSSYRNRIQKKYAVGSKNQIQIENAAKKKKMDKLLMGKTLMPHLGANWNDKSMANMNIVLEPKCVNVIGKKRTFESMRVGDDEFMDNDDMMPRKKSKMQNHNLCDSKMEEIDMENMRNLEIENEEKEIVSSVCVKIFVCKYSKCSLKDKAMEKANSFCRAHAQNIVQTVGRKYFWKCVYCGGRTSTLNTKRVMRKCKGCGKKKYVAAAVDKNNKKS